MRKQTFECRGVGMSSKTCEGGPGHRRGRGPTRCRRRPLAILLGVAGGLPALPALAASGGGVTFYTDPSAFSAAAGSTKSFGFSGVVTGNTGATTAYANAAGFTRDGVTFVGTTGNGGYSIGIQGPDFITADYNHGLDKPSLQGPALTSGFYGITNGATTITFAKGVTSFGLTLFDVLAGDYSGSGTDTVNLTVNGRSGSVVTPQSTGAAFLGFTAANPITSVTLTGTAAEEFPTITDVVLSGSGSGPTPVKTGVINTTDGDLAANVFSLGSEAATASKLQFQGGTLQFSGGDFLNNVVTAPVTISAQNGTVDTSAGDGGFAGVVSGAGALMVTGGGTFSLSGANTYAGGTVLQAGTLLVTDGSALGTGALTLRAGTTLATQGSLTLANAVALSGDPTFDVPTDDTVTVSGTVSDASDGRPAGAVEKTGGGTLVLAAANTYTGGTTLQAGTLALGSATALGTGELRMAANTTLAFAADGLTVANPIAFGGTTTGAAVVDPAVDTGAMTETLSGAITGAGALTKLGTGTLDLAGAGTYAGGTEVTAGTLLVDGSVTSVVTVDNGATLGGGGTVGGVVLAGGAVLAPGRATAAGTLSVAGDVTFAAGSTYRVVVNSDGASRLAATGRAALGGAGLAVVAGSGPFTPGSTYTILTAANGVSGTFGTLAADTALTAFLQPSLSYGDDDVMLTLGAKPFATAAATPNGAAVANAIQALGPGSALYGDVLPLSPEGARQALGATSGTSHAGSTTAQTQTARIVTDLIFDRLWDVGGSGLGARQLLEKLAPDTLPTLVRCYAPAPSPVPTPAGYTAWGEAFGDFGHSGTANSGSLDRSLGGVVAGVDTEVEGLPGGHGRAGAAVGYTSTFYRSPLDGGDGTVQAAFGSLYGGARFGAVDVRLGTTVGETFNGNTRTVAFPGFNETERSNNDGYVAQGFGEVGYRLPAGRFVLEPVAGAAVVHVHQDAFAERGGVAALTGASEDNDVETTTLGFRGEAAPFGAIPLVLHGFLGWQHAFGDVNPATVLAFEAAAGANSFTVTGAPIDRDALAAEASLDWRATQAVSLSLSYTGLVSGTSDDNAVKGRAEYRF